MPNEVCNGNRSVLVNALLDNASTKVYIYSKVTAELGLAGDAQITQVQSSAVKVITKNYVYGRSKQVIYDTSSKAVWLIIRRTDNQADMDSKILSTQTYPQKATCKLSATLHIQYDFRTCSCHTAPTVTC